MRRPRPVDRRAADFTAGLSHGLDRLGKGSVQPAMRSPVKPAARCEPASCAAVYSETTCFSTVCKFSFRFSHQKSGSCTVDGTNAEAQKQKLIFTFFENLRLFSSQGNVFQSIKVHVGYFLSFSDFHFR